MAKTIDIKTTQNVTITYELAAPRDRIIAFVVDTLAKGLVALITLWMYAMLPYSVQNDFEDFYAYLIYIPLFMLPMLIMESTMSGQTLGKKLMKIKVVKLNGKQPVFYDFMLRWAFRLLDVYFSMGVLGTLMIASTDFSQRFGDKLSNTTVVRVSNKIGISLKEILTIDNKQSYVPIYPGVRAFREDDIILIKNVLDRYQKYKNESHKKAVLSTVEKVCQKLQLEQMPDEKIKFLRTVIKDYIVLTR